MRLLLALDSRPANRAAIGILDPHTGAWERFQTFELDERFKRVGFRGCALADDQLYVVSSAALYQIALETDRTRSGVGRVVRSLRRPEWELGERSAADLHHVHHSAVRQRLFIANSFMDAVDEVSLDLRFLRRHYLWDLSPAVAEEALHRHPNAVDLVHVNHICEHAGRLYLTCGNWNRTRQGKVLCFDTGEIVLDGLRFPHDGFIHEGDFYLSETEAQRLLVYRGFGGSLLGRTPDLVLPATIRQRGWTSSFQWVRGIGVTPGHIIGGVTQWRDDDVLEPQIPPRLVFWDRASGEHRGDLFLPPVDEFPTPSIFSVHVLDDDRPEVFDLAAWTASAPAPRAELVVPPRRPIEALPLAFTSPAGDLAPDWYYSPPPAGEWVVVPSTSGTITVMSKMAPSDRFFLRTGPTNFDHPPDRPDTWRIEPGKDYELEARALEYEGKLQMQLWLIEYGHRQRLRHHTEKLPRSGGRIRFRPSSDTESIRIGLRFAGPGRVLLAPLRLHEIFGPVPVEA